MQRRASSNTVGYQPAKYLGKAVEAEPDSYACSLLSFGVPLGREEGEAGCHRSFEDTEEKPDGNGAGVVLHSCHAAEDQAPHYDAEGGVLGQREALKESSGWIFPREIACKTSVMRLRKTV